MAKGMYVPLDVNYLRDPKIRRAGPDAELLYVRGLAYAKGGFTDGLIADFDVPVVGVGLSKISARVAALVREGLWLKTCDGYEICGWTKWNKTNGELSEAKEAKRRGAEATNHKRYHIDGGEPSWSCALCKAEGLA